MLSRNARTYGTGMDYSCKTVFFGIFAVCLIGYSVAIGIYECYAGGVAAALVAEYHDYSASVNGSQVRVAIDAFPRDIYKNTKTFAEILLVCGVVGVVTAICAAVYATFKKSREVFALGAAASNGVVILIPFCYCAFLTWKLHSLSEIDKETWNAVDTEFIRSLERAEKLMIATVVPGVFWCIVACVLWCVSVFTD